MLSFFDAHSDIWTDVALRRLKGETHIVEQYHLPRLRKGGIEGAVFSLWTNTRKDGFIQRTQQLIDCAEAEIAETNAFRIVRTYSELVKAKADKIFYVLPGVESLASIGTNLSGIDRLHDFGVRIAMLTWNETNALGAGAMSGCSDGLTELGKQAVRILQNRRMIVDVSHLNEAGFRDIVKLSNQPFIASHSNCRALCDSPRNLTDDQLRAIRDSGGVVGLNAYSRFVHADRNQQTVETLANHAAHMIDVMGIDHVGCGFDFCEFMEDVPPTIGLENASQVQHLSDCLQRMGLSHEEQEKIAYGNFHRVLREVTG